MRALSASDILRVWEQGQQQPSWAQALTMLAVACPEMTWDTLAELPIGRRDAGLLALRRQTFGATLHGFAECPRCTRHLEFALSAADLQTDPPPTAPEQTLDIAMDEWQLRVRQPNSLDLAALTGCNDPHEARRLLVERCVMLASHHGSPVPCDALSEEVIGDLGSRLAASDPQAEVLLDLHCPECGHNWQMFFDITSFLWDEIWAQARRLLREVHRLAQAYGWCEADILAMSTARRRAYLEMLT
jgi:hypothetical protein